MYFIGLTGGIGSGKSEALAACSRLGAAVLSSDAVVHDLLQTDAVKTKLVQRWGDQVLTGDGIDRDAVAGVVFGRPEELAWLEQAIFPLVGQRVAAWKAGLERDGKVNVAVVETPLLFEAGMEAVFDATIAVVADEQLRVERAGSRDHEGLEGRGARQLTQDEKARRADFVVRNDHSLDHLAQQMAEVLEQVESGVDS